MGDTVITTGLRPRIAGKWQIPLLIVSTLILARAVYRLRPPLSELPLSESLRVLDDLVESGLHGRVGELAEKLLARKDATDNDRSVIHLQRARSRFAQALSDRNKAIAGSRIVEDFRFAQSRGRTLSAADVEAVGRALEWQGKIGEAVEAYGEAITAGATSPYELRRHIIELRRDHLRVPATELEADLEGFLADSPADRLDLRSWAVAARLDVLEQLGRLDQAADLLQTQRDSFHGTEFAGRFEYLEALLLYKQGARDEAERRLRALRNRLDRSDDVDAMAGWLLGRVVLSDDGPQRPQEAASFFSEVILNHGSGSYVTASRIGLAEALAQLERHDEAVASCRLALEELERGGDSAVIDRDVLRVSLGVTAESLRQAGHLREAAEYLPLAAKLAESVDVEQAALVQRQVAQVYALIAEQLNQKANRADADDTATDSEREVSRAFYTEAAEAFQKLAELQKSDEGASADASWRASELFGRAGHLERAVEILDAFRSERVHHPVVPRALLRIGQLRQRMGQLGKAVDSYQECYRRFPRTLEGARALVPMAQCYLSLEPRNIELVEKTLRVVLEESEVFTPAAPEFTDALFLLGDALWRQGEFERAMLVLQETLDRYPKDPRFVRTKFLLADSYRQSALAVKRGAGVTPSGFREQDLRDDYAGRFAEARGGFRDVINALEERPREELNPLETVLLRHAYLYEADCRFEVQEYREALHLYDLAASLFKDYASALGAYVQMIHCYVFLGESQEARAALTRALVLADALPAPIFEVGVAPESREDWKRYLEWLSSSGLF